MRSMDGRVSKLEHQFGLKRSGTPYLLILMRAGQEIGPTEEAYIKSLDEAGVLRTTGLGFVNLIPIGERKRVVPPSTITIELETERRPQ